MKNTVDEKHIDFLHSAMEQCPPPPPATTVWDMPEIAVTDGDFIRSKKRRPYMCIYSIFFSRRGSLGNSKSQTDVQTGET